MALIRGTGGGGSGGRGGSTPPRRRSEPPNRTRTRPRPVMRGSRSRRDTLAKAVRSAPAPRPKPRPKPKPKHTPHRPKPKPKHTPHSSGGSGGGGGGGGGGGDGGASAAAQAVKAAAAAQASYMAAYNKALKRIADERAALNSEYKKDRAELEENFEFAETAREKALIASRIAELDRRRDDGMLAIEQGYAAAQTEVRDRADQMDIDNEVGAQETAQRFSNIAGQIRDNANIQIGPDGLGGGAQQTDLSDVNDYVGTVGAAETLAQQRFGDVAEEDVRWLGDQLGGESESQQAGLTQAALGMVAESTQQHDAQVSGRIQQERMMFAQQVADLQGAFRSRGWNLTDNEASTLVQMAEAQRQSAEAAAARAQQASQFNSTMSFKRQQANRQESLARAQMAQSAANSRRAASRAGSRGSGGSSGPAPLSDVQAIELEQAKMDRANEAFSAYGSTGVAPGLKGYVSSGLRSSAIGARGGPYRAGGAPKPSNGLSDAMNGFIKGWG